MIAAITGRGLRPPAANGRVRRKAGALLVAAAILSAVAVVSAPAETLRVGKAGRDAFSFVPADVGARTGIFRQHGVDIEISSLAATPVCSRRWRLTASMSGSAPDPDWPSS